MTSISLNLIIVPESTRQVIRESIKMQRPLEEQSIREREIYGALETFLSELGRESQPFGPLDVSAYVSIDDDGFSVSISTVSSKARAEALKTDATESAEPQGGEDE